MDLETELYFLYKILGHCLTVDTQIDQPYDEIIKSFTAALTIVN